MWQQLKEDINKGNINALARCISFIENEKEGYLEMLASLPQSAVPIIGITGPPGAGKSTITDALIAVITGQKKKVAVICVDPSSPFNLGALLGDRIRMSRWYNEPDVFIRSLATRGALGGLNPKIIEITDLLKFAHFDFIIIETVGVGQSEIEIAGLADVTIVTLVPEGGDEIQTMKAGLMEIADIFIVNKADRPGADHFFKNLKTMLAPAFSAQKEEVQVIKTIALHNSGIAELYEAIKIHLQQNKDNEKKYYLLAEKAWQLLQKKRMMGLDKNELLKKIKMVPIEDFNLYRFIENL